MVLGYRQADVKEDAIELLAERLYFVMERLDPTPDAPAWARVSEFDREFYRACIRAIADEQALLRVLCR